MGRAVYGSELNDPDFSWLVNSFRASHPEFLTVESAFLPIVFVRTEEQEEVVAQSFGADCEMPLDSKQ